MCVCLCDGYLCCVTQNARALGGCGPCVAAAAQAAEAHASLAAADGAELVAELGAELAELRQAASLWEGSQEQLVASVSQKKQAEADMKAAWDGLQAEALAEKKAHEATKQQLEETAAAAAAATQHGEAQMSRWLEGQAELESTWASERAVAQSQLRAAEAESSRLQSELQETSVADASEQQPVAHERGEVQADATVGSVGVTDRSVSSSDGEWERQLRTVSLESQCSTMASQLGRLRAEGESAAAVAAVQRSTLERELSASRTQIEELSGELRGAQDAADRWQAEVTELQAHPPVSFHAPSSTEEQLRAEISSVHSQLSAALLEKTELSLRLEGAEDSVMTEMAAAYEEESQELRAALTEEQVYSGQLASELGEVRTQLEEERCEHALEHDALAARHSQSEGEMERLHRDESDILCCLAEVQAEKQLYARTHLPPTPPPSPSPA
jgi:hypothetical protein